MNCTFFAFLVTHTLHGCAAVVVVLAAAVALVVALLENRYTCAIYPKTKRTAAVAAAKEAADLMTRLHSHNATDAHIHTLTAASATGATTTNDSRALGGAKNDLISYIFK